MACQFRVIALTILMFFVSLGASAASQVAAVFVLDESGSVATQDFDLERAGFRSALAVLPTNASIDIGVIYFSTNAVTRIGLTLLTSGTVSSIDAGLGARTDRGSTNMSAAISSAASMLSASSAKTKLIFLSTDGVPNSASAASSAAAAARGSGIKVIPIGIGLTGTGQAFLDSIATNPPVPNPGDFTTFGTVVKNIILAAIGSSVNLALTPNALDFGGANPTLQPTKSIRIVNNSDSPLSLTSVNISGTDTGSYKIVSIAGNASPSFPFSIPTKGSTEVLVQLAPINSPANSNYDAILNVGAQNSEGTTGTSSASLHGVVGSFQLTVLDARPLLNRISGDSFLDASGASITEQQIADVTGTPRVGVATDGNARLLLRAQVSGLDGSVRISLKSAATNAKIQPLTDATATGATQTIQLQSVTGSQSFDRQASAILKAGDYFSGTNTDPTAPMQVEACLILSGQTACAQTITENLIEVKAPVVLVHGIWSSAKDGFGKGKSTGLSPTLQRLHYEVGYFEYEGERGPSQTITPDEGAKFAAQITLLCVNLIATQNVACTRANLVVHSLGGLVTREFIRLDKKNRGGRNYQQGSINRLITLGTPHTGSPFANLLSGENACLQGQELRDVQARLNSGIAGLGALRIASGVSDLREEGSFVRELNLLRSTLSGKLSLHTVVGNVGTTFPTFVPSILDWYQETPCTYANVFGNRRSDQVVPIDSAQWISASSNTSTLLAQHIGMGTNAVVINRVTELLSDTGPLFSSLITVARTSIDRFFKAVLAWANEAVSALDAKSWSLALLGVSNVHAQSSAITLQASDSSPAPGSSVTLTAIVTGAPQRPVTLTDFATINLPLTAAPYIWTINVPLDSFDVINLVAGTRIANAGVESNVVTITPRFDLSLLTSIRFDSPAPRTIFTGGTLQLDVMGLFNDGINRNISASRFGTTYTKLAVNGGVATAADSPAISISPDGLITANSLGVADVTASSSGKTATVRISVQAVPAELASAGSSPDTGTPVNNSGGSAGGSGGCFIATAAYGSYFDPNVKILRDFRDRFLLSHHSGQSFVHWYYQVSPPIADSVRTSEAMKSGIRIILLPAVGFAYLCLKIGGLTALLILFLLAFMTIVGIRTLYRLRYASHL